MAKREEVAAEKLLGELERFGFQLEGRKGYLGLVSAAGVTTSKAIAVPLAAGLRAFSHSHAAMQHTAGVSQAIITATNTTRHVFRAATKAFIIIDAIFLVADTVSVIAQWVRRNPTVANIDTLIDALK